MVIKIYDTDANPDALIATLSAGPVSLRHDTNDFYFVVEGTNKKIHHVDVELGKSEDPTGSIEITTLGLAAGQRFDIAEASLDKTLAGQYDYRSGATWSGDGYSERIFVNFPKGAGQEAEWFIQEQGAPGLKLKITIRRKVE